MLVAFDPEVRSVKQRRSFSAEEKARILAEYEAAATPLERAALMRREAYIVLCFRTGAGSSRRKRRLASEAVPAIR